jgi:hypothetical protein
MHGVDTFGLWEHNVLFSAPPILDCAESFGKELFKIVIFWYSFCALNCLWKEAATAPVAEIACPRYTIRRVINHFQAKRTCFIFKGIIA